MRKCGIALVLLFVGTNLFTYAATGYLTAKKVRTQTMVIADTAQGMMIGPLQREYPENFVSVRIGAIKQMSEASGGLMAFHSYAGIAPYGALGLILAGTGVLLLSAKNEPRQNEQREE